MRRDKKSEEVRVKSEEGLSSELPLRMTRWVKINTFSPFTVTCNLLSSQLGETGARAGT